ncbi:hypothetical protein CDAR_254151 [Caerostris darwini]|uniref:Uncharacterized protein n=1 Tax=Caerostris darwini TaxID=1538125 RepID=A0AAV4MF65_9ARAC|nr:hypothetical protein CDAR_254151 [Caerostris darwini]
MPGNLTFVIRHSRRQKCIGDKDNRPAKRHMTPMNCVATINPAQIPEGPGPEPSIRADLSPWSSATSMEPWRTPSLLSNQKIFTAYIQYKNKRVYK